MPLQHARVLAFLIAVGCSSAPKAEDATGTAGSPGSGGDPATAGSGGSAPIAGNGGAGGSAGPPSFGGGPSEPFGAFGQDTPGGKDGAIVKVTTLDGDGPGSLREALATTGPRIVVFEVGGIIDLNQAPLMIAEPFLTIAGETAPSPGITIIRGGLRVTTHDVILRHLRLRMGDAGSLAGAGFEPDVTTDGANAHHVLFDHMSVSWGVDENLSVSGDRYNGPVGTSHHVTIRNSIIAEGLFNSVHEKGDHSMGTLIHDFCSDVAVIGNLYAHNDERNPWFKGFASGVVVNNVVYNPGTWAMRLGAVESEWAGRGITPEGPRVSVVGNYMRHGADSPATLAMVGTNSSGSAYLEDNIAVDALGAPVAIASATVTMLSEKPSWPDGLEALAATSVADAVVASAGARPKDRDAVDERIIADFLAGTGGFIDSQEQVGGYPSVPTVTRTLDVPTADIEAWLAEFAAELE